MIIINFLSYFPLLQDLTPSPAKEFHLFFNAQPFWAACAAIVAASIGTLGVVLGVRGQKEIKAKEHTHALEIIDRQNQKNTQEMAKVLYSEFTNAYETLEVRKKDLTNWFNLCICNFITKKTYANLIKYQYLEKNIENLGQLEINCVSHMLSAYYEFLDFDMFYDDIVHDICNHKIKDHNAYLNGKIDQKTLTFFETHTQWLDETVKHVQISIAKVLVSLSNELDIPIKNEIISTANQLHNSI